MKEMMNCVICGKDFSFTQEEREFYKTLGYTAEPKRCKICRGTEKALVFTPKPAREMYTVTCAECGIETQIPFKPTGDKPVYCRSCLGSRKIENKNVRKLSK